MRSNWSVFAAIPLLLLTAACVGPGPGITGNDTGGIIPWSPYTQQVARQLAAEHCAQYGKRGYITSMRARYGEYIAFACSWR